jgi:hypothetical protein
MINALFFFALALKIGRLTPLFLQFALGAMIWGLLGN